MVQASKAGGADCYLGAGEPVLGARKPVSGAVEAGFGRRRSRFSRVYKRLTFCLSLQTFPGRVRQMDETYIG